MIWADKIVKLYRQLFPTGRAFKMPVGGFFENLMTGMSKQAARFKEDADSILDSAIPDNDNFTSDDATDWERRLGLISNPDVALSDRKLAILRKMAFPGQARARMSITFLQGQLQAAGFNVYAYENLDNLSPYSVSGASEILSDVEYGEIEYGETDYGKYYNNKLVNYIETGKDNNFNEGGSFRGTLIIGGPTRGSYANVDINRRDEFRQLVLRLKGTEKVAYLFIHYTY